jgi:hypothetical protein
MVHARLQLSEEHEAKLRRLAAEEGVSEDEIVTRCVVRALDEAGERRARYERASRLVGAFPDPDGADDLAAGHDRYLGDGVAPAR